MGNIKLCATRKHPTIPLSRPFSLLAATVVRNGQKQYDQNIDSFISSYRHAAFRVVGLIIFALKKQHNKCV